MEAAYPRIEKETLNVLHFAKEEVLRSEEAIEARRQALDTACRLGNEFKGKVKIAFVTTEGVKEVVTTVWNVGDELVSFKSGNFIPIHSILYVGKE